MADRISRIRIEGIRSLAKVDVPLRPLTVLIGENGTGKSSFIEALELLRRLPGPNFIRELSTEHGGLRTLLTDGEKRITLGVEVTSDLPEDTLAYSITIGLSGEFPSIEREQLVKDPGASIGLDCLYRDGPVVQALDQATLKMVDVPDIKPNQPLISAYLPPQPAIARMKGMLERIAVHLPFPVTPSWAAGGRQRSPLREPATIVPAERLERYGENLASAYQALRNNFSPQHWQETLEYIRLGLGESVQDVQVRTDPGGGRVAIALRFSELSQPVPAVAISDGMLAYLAHVALFRLNGGESLIAFDEPEQHLHPRLLARMVGFYEAISASRPVILATQSDRVLDALATPENSAVLLELDEARHAEFRWPDPVSLRKWLDHFAGFAEMRSSGHESSFFTAPLPGTT